MGLAEYRITKNLPKNIKESSPIIEKLEAKLSRIPDKKKSFYENHFCEYTVLPDTIVRTTRPFTLRPSKGEFFDLLAKLSILISHS